MPGFLYYLPAGPRVATAATLRAIGLGYALAGEGVTSCHTARGPDGGEGVVATIDRDGIDTRYVADRQSWRRAAGGKVWVGRWTDGPAPGPKDLSRDTPYEGVAVKLRDGNEWIVPRCHAMLPGRPVALPQVLDLDESGERWQTRPAPEFAALCEDAHHVWEIFLGLRENDLTGDDAARIGVAALAANYRVSAVEIAMLGLWSTQELKAVVRGIIDVDAAMAAMDAQKKTDMTGTFNVGDSGRRA